MFCPRRGRQQLGGVRGGRGAEAAWVIIESGLKPLLAMQAPLHIENRIFYTSFEEPKDGFGSPDPQKPGLGLELDPAAAKAYAV